MWWEPCTDKQCTNVDQVLTIQAEGIDCVTPCISLSSPLTIWKLLKMSVKVLGTEIHKTISALLQLRCGPLVQFGVVARVTGVVNVVEVIRQVREFGFGPEVVQLVVFCSSCKQLSHETVRTLSKEIRSNVFAIRTVPAFLRWCWMCSREVRHPLVGPWLQKLRWSYCQLDF